MAFDDNSFDTEAFSVASWLFEIVEAIKQFFRQFVFTQQYTDLTVAKESNEIWVKRKI